MEQCCGCRSCEHICPTNSISFIKDIEGFLIPYVNEQTCVKCQKCVRNCPQINEVSLNTNIRTYAALNKNGNDVMCSSSGGMMSALADKVLADGGVVFGAYLDSEDWKCKFRYTSDRSGLEPLRGSKYLQSDTGKSYKEVKEFLGKDIVVLYVASPCQIAGLLAFLGRPYEKLYTIDLLCHGATSPDLFMEHVRYLEAKYKRKLTGFSFRDKSRTPNKVAYKYRFGDREKCVLGKCEKYHVAYLSGATYRIPCYKCKYAQRNRIGDITLGDYWGITKVHPDFNALGGVSLVLINTVKGGNLLKSTNALFVESDINKASDSNGILNAPAAMNCKRNTFYTDVKQYGYEAAIKKNFVVKSGIYNEILMHLPRPVINILLKL